MVLLYHLNVFFLTIGMASSQVFILPINFRFLQCIDDHCVVTVVSIVPLTDINVFHTVTVVEVNLSPIGVLLLCFLLIFPQNAYFLK